MQSILPLTSLRFAAALLVFLHHANATTDPDVQKAFGTIGVGFFFMLSGLILAHVYHDRLRTVGLRQFYQARVARIAPLHFFTAFLALSFFPPEVTWKEPVRLAINLSLLHAWFPLPSVYFSFNAPSWSLSVEAAFYLLFPVLLPAVLRLPRSLLLVSPVLIFSMMCAWSLAWAGDHWAVYIFPLARLGEFVSGIILWRLIAGRMLPSSVATVLELVTLLAMALLIWRFTLVPPALQWSAGFYFFCFAILGVFYFSAGAVSQMLSVRPIVWLGEVSFAFYLVHQLVIRLLPDTSLWIWLALSIAGAALLHHALEVPLQRLLVRCQKNRATA